MPATTSTSATTAHATTATPTDDGAAVDLLGARLRAPGYRAWRAQVAGHRRLRRPHPPHRLLADPGPRRRRARRTRRRRARPLRQPPRRGLPRLRRPLRRRRLPPAARRTRRRSHQGRAGDRRRAPAGVPDPDRAVVRAGAHPHRHPPRARHPLPVRAIGTTPTTPASAPPPTPTPTTTKARCCGRPTPGCCGPGSPPPCAAPWPPRSASGARDFPDHARLSYAKVAEYQRRGLVHFHAVIRLDGPDGPTDPPPTGLTHGGAARRHHHRRPQRAAHHRPTGRDLARARLGCPARPAPRHRHGRGAARERDGEITDAALAGYIAKYATKSTGAVDRGEGADRPIRDGEHIAHLDVTPHHRRMIETAWQLGDLPQYDALNLRRWAHMLGFRGHFLTKSRAYSITFSAIRAASAAPGACAPTSTSSPPTPTTTATTSPRRPRHRHRHQRLARRPHRPPRPRRTRTRPRHRRTQPRPATHHPPFRRSAA